MSTFNPGDRVRIVPNQVDEWLGVEAVGATAVVTSEEDVAKVGGDLKVKPLAEGDVSIRLDDFSHIPAMSRAIGAMYGYTDEQLLHVRVPESVLERIEEEAPVNA